MVNKEELLNLSKEEKLDLIEELWESLDKELDNEIPEWKRELAKERLQYHNDNPGNGVEWNELKKKYQR